MRSENGQLLMIPQQALAQMQAQAHAQAQPQTTMAPRPATPTSAPPVQISTVQVSHAYTLHLPRALWQASCPTTGWLTLVSRTVLLGRAGSDSLRAALSP